MDSGEHASFAWRHISARGPVDAFECRVTNSGSRKVANSESLNTRGIHRKLEIYLVAEFRCTGVDRLALETLVNPSHTEQIEGFLRAWPQPLHLSKKSEILASTARRQKLVLPKSQIRIDLRLRRRRFGAESLCNETRPPGRIM